MKNLDFTFKKSRTLGELIGDFFSLFKQIFKHFTKNILTVSLPFIALFVLFIFFFLGSLPSYFQGFATFPVSSILSFELGAFLVAIIFSFIIATFGIEYMFLLEEKGTTDFSAKDVLRRVRSRVGKYLLFGLCSILITLIIIVPIVIVNLILAFIPIIGSFGSIIFMAMISLFFYCALFLYLSGRESLWGSYGASLSLIKSKVFAYGLASFIIQFISQIILSILIIIPILILGIIAYNTVGFDMLFFSSFAGKFIIAIGVAILTFFAVFFGIYLLCFYVLQYFSLLEISYSEATLDDIDQIGNVQSEG